MIQFKIENPNQYKPTDIVRVTVTIKEGYDKKDVIDKVCEEMEGLSFKLHNTKIYDKGFTANIQYSLIDELKTIEGIESVELSKKVDMNTPSNEEVTIQQEENIIDNTPIMFTGLAVVLLGAFIYKKIKK